MTVHINHSSDGDFRLTKSLVQDLLDLRVRHKRDREKLAREEAETDRRLEAVRILAPHLFPDFQDDAQPSLAGMETARTGGTLSAAIVKAVGAVAGPMTPAEIRNAVIAQGDGYLVTNRNYLYTAIKRAADKGKIAKGKGVYFRASPKGDAPEAKASGEPS